MTINYRFVVDTNELDDAEVGLGAPFINVERFALDASPLNDVGFGLDGDASFKVVGSADSEAGELFAQASAEIIITVVALADATLGGVDGEAVATVEHGAVGASSFGGLSASASADIDNPATGEASLGGANAEASATVSHSAQAVSQFQTVSASGQALIVVNASGVTVVSALVASADGLVIPVGEGVADAPLGSLDASASASVIRRAGGGGGIRWIEQLPPKPIVVVKDVPQEVETIVVEREPVSVFATASVRFPVLRARAVGSVSWVAERDDEELLLLL